MISAIVCADMNNAIGYKGELLGRIPEDMQRFKSITENNIILMGRKTWESLPNKPLLNRINWVVSRSVPYGKVRGFINDYIESDLATAIKFINMGHCGEVFVVGGGEIYKEMLPYCDRIYFTRVYHMYPDADTYFPKILESTWKLSLYSDIKQWRDVQYRFEIYDRIGDDLNG